MIKFYVDDYIKHRNTCTPWKTNYGLNLDECFECYTGGYPCICGTCKNNQAISYTSFINFPKLLIIALIRKKHTYFGDIDFKYNFATGVMEAVNNNITINIDNDRFTGLENKLAFRKIEEFKVTDSSARITDLGDSFKFYANGDFISTFIEEDGADWPNLYGQWGIANSIAEGDGDLTLTVMYSYEVDSNYDYFWIAKTEPEEHDIELADFAFTLDGEIYTRQ